ncbi:MAG TPA: methyl coenzyme M reductase system, component A2 [Methanolinea sp.]|jgi:methyl coenzyme M reductase system subunit A2|nr:methyl coenzyme M reductase system, component A2 [Methanolinea sp.]HOS82032.1 methyl coenzyme M reductase system, component A2 [Methanolinea sp.]HPC55347.1 methyl coenzyme M reductase system, component A2 [Methanolinea sp.]HQE85697.1 methyl coenzyme M reductase system, component A2 [Methanolinea sp.]HQI14516.1 methyl coenzyme M reductase system, component A2 [Methanolinea sp.]
MNPLITVKNLCMDFDGKKVLKNISFEIGEGEVLGIIGRSGAGKTVLMHLLRGVEQHPTSGQIIYHVAVCDSCPYIGVGSMAGKPCPSCGSVLRAQDIDLWNEKDEDLRRRLMRRTAIMFQRTFALYGNDRVIENVLHALDDIDYPQDKAINRAADLLDQVRLSHRMMHIARDLSGGEKQRVVLARQLAKDPFLLFADEPTGTLDPETADLVHRMLTEACRRNHMGMVVTSHFSQVIKSVADRAMLLVDGNIAMLGSPDEVITKFMADLSDTETFEVPEFGREILIARDVFKRYISVDRGVVRAVNGVTFEVYEREIFGIIGKSGAGKTTLSRIMAGIIEPTAGEMIIRIGEDAVDMTKPGIENRGRAKGYIGLLHQEYDLYPHRTVLDNLTDAIGLEFPKELAMRKAVITLKMAGFSEEKSREILDRLPGQLSEGERHRVALAQVLIREPRMVILDEPTGTMDPLTKVDVKHSIMHARDEMDETFIVVSHDIDFVRDICDRLALMRGGKIVAIGRTADVLATLTAEEREVMGTATSSSN